MPGSVGDFGLGAIFPLAIINNFGFIVETTFFGSVFEFSIKFNESGFALLVRRSVPFNSSIKLLFFSGFKGSEISI